MTFTSIEQRMVNTYLDTFPAFVPSEDGPGVKAQEQFHGFMKGLWETLRDNPRLLVAQLHEDDAHSNRFNKAADGKPKLRDLMRRMIKELESLVSAMMAIGQNGRTEGQSLRVSCKISRKHRSVLETVGVHAAADHCGISLAHGKYPQLFAAWQWMATRPRATALEFSRCFFRRDYAYTSDIYARLFGNEKAFRRLERHLRQQGYSAFVNHDGQTVSLDYLNLRGEQVKPKLGFQYGVRYTGISASYDCLVKDPPVLGICIPWMKELLSGFATLPPGVRDFMLGRTRRCGNCGYCVQTDKTGKRPRARIAVRSGEQTLQLCPYFPGYDYCWTRIDDSLVDGLIAMLSWMDRAYGPRSKSA